MCESLLSRLPIDIVEMMIVSSDDYSLYEVLQKMLLKLNDPSRKSRINDKLTKVSINEYGIQYKLNNKLHREYNKPSCISKIQPPVAKLFNHNYYHYHIYGQKLRKDGMPTIGNVYRDSDNHDDYNSPTCLVMFFRECATFLGVKSSIRFLDYETVTNYFIFDC